MFGRIFTIGVCDNFCRISLDSNKQGNVSMKVVKSNIYRQARIVLNTGRTDRSQWAKIVEANGRVAHTGQINYIRRIAKQKYNLNPSL